MRRIRLHTTLIAVLICGATTVALGYPIQPAPLWRLVHDSDAIVLATVVRVDEPPPRAPRVDSEDEAEDEDVEIEEEELSSSGQVARLHVLETWKGTTDADLAIPFEAHMVCPAPPRYEPGRTVLAFLTADKARDRWVTTSLSYGTRYPEPQDLPVLKARVDEAIALQSRKGVERAERLEWLVRCAENTVTRWDGAFELAGSRRRHASDDGELRIPPAELLTDAQRERLARGFEDDPRLDGSVLVLLDVLIGHRDDRLDRALVEAMDRRLASDDPDGMLRYVARGVLERLGDARAEERLEPLREIREEKAGWEALRKAWAAAKAALEKPAQSETRSQSVPRRVQGHVATATSSS